MKENNSEDTLDLAMALIGQLHEYQRKKLAIYLMCSTLNDMEIETITDGLVDVINAKIDHQILHKIKVK
jgi:hypothetical protein